MNRQDRLATPDPSAMRRDYKAMEQFSLGIIALECLVVLLAVVWIVNSLSRSGVLTNFWPWISAAIGALGVFRWLAHHFFMNKKRLQDIRQDATFGVHTRDSLIDLAHTVFARLGIPRDAAPVFLIREKDVNAHAVRCELLPGLRLFNGVFLNRSIIHLLSRAELASVIGHELGHVFPYAPILSRCYLIHSLFAGSVSMALTITFGVPGAAILVPLALLWLIDWIIGIPHMKLSRTIEFLCDDCGAKASGLLPALKSELKFGVENEMRQRLLLRTLEAREKGAAVNLRDLLEAYEEAVPFGKADPEAFEKDFQKFAAAQKQSSKGVSLQGFARFLQGTDDAGAEPNESEKELVERLSKLDKLPLLPFDRAAYLQEGGDWKIQEAEQLMSLIQKHPDCVVARLENEVDDCLATHPGLSRRLLYLWRNRDQFPLTF
jgi:Zn-dependent protease with chaperone function